MNTTTKIACVLATILLLAVTVDKPLAAEHAAEKNDGSQLYLSYQCWQCHGYEGQGGAAPRIAPSAYPWEAFLRFVRYPNEMPAYPKELLSDDELRAIYDYLQSIPEPRPVEDIPALNDL